MTKTDRRARRRKGPILPTLLRELKNSHRGARAQAGEDHALFALTANAFDARHDGLRATLMRASAQGHRLHYAVVHRPTGLILFGPHYSLQGLQMRLNKWTDFAAGVLYVSRFDLNRQAGRHWNADDPALPLVKDVKLRGRSWGDCYAFPRAEVAVEAARVRYVPAWAGPADGLTAPQLPEASPLWTAGWPRQP